MSINLRSPFKHPPRNANDALLSRRNELRLRRPKRFRFKIKPTTPPTQLIRSQFGNFIPDFVSRFPSVDTVVPALGLVSGLGFYINKLNKNTKQETDDDDDNAGDWMLFTTPSPFTRFVMLRCPSLRFIGPGDVNEKLLKEDRHLVKFDPSGVYGASDVVESLEYQRLCVPTDDGGVIAIDLPAHLNLGEDDGLDTTLLLIPGLAEGSMDKNVQMFVSQGLKSGCFPVVLNPRGCAGSPLTTPRMFTAADSDDVYKAVQYISKMRPRTTIMAIGWGYGANMLTKYLAEVGDKTPVTAATCFDNHFDLPEYPKTFQQNHVDKKLLDGLKNILRKNKEIFQGKVKGFEVERALLAESVREFDSFISMISYGFLTIEDFYSACSTHSAVKDIRVPVLFIQSDNEIQPLFYTPHSSISHNPFTSLLLHSLPSKLVDGSGAAVSWCQYVTIEWLAAVELGLLKGHHPHTKVVDASLCLLGGRGFYGGGNAKLLDYKYSEFLNDGRVDPTGEMLDQNVVTTATTNSRAQTYSGNGSTSQQQMNSAQFVEENSVQADSLNTDEESAVDDDKGQVLQTAQIVLNMLEVSMPGTFSPEQKEKVLTAVSQGSTVLNALQDAVPEDAREKLTTTVSEIFSNGKKLKLDGFLNRGQKSGEETSDMDGSNSQNSNNGIVDPEEHESGNASLSNKQQSGANDVQHLGEEGNGDRSQLIDGLVDQDASSVPEGIVGSTDGGVTETSVKDEVAHSDHNNTPSNSALKNKEPTVDQTQRDVAHGTPQLASEEENNAQNIDEKDKDSSVDPDKIELPTETGQAISSSLSDTESDVKKETKDVGTKLVQENGKAGPSNIAPPSIQLTETFDALTGMDDSTQVAVNSVFGVIEGMITQLEEKTSDEKEVKNIQDADSEKPHHGINNSPDIKEKGNNVNQLTAEIKDSSTSVESLELHHKIMNEKDNGSFALSPSQDEQPHHVIINSPDIKEKGNNIQNDEMKYSAVTDYSGDSLESDHKITNKMAGETMIKHSSQGDQEPSWSHGGHSGNNEKYNDQASSSNLSCSLPHRGTNMGEGSDLNSEKLKLPSLQGIKEPDMNAHTSAHVDYFSEEGQSKPLELSEISSDSDKSIKSIANDFSGLVKVTDADLSQENTIIDTERPKKLVGDRDKGNDIHEVGKTKIESVHGLDHLVGRIIKDAIKAEILCRLNETDVKEISHNLSNDLELVSNFITQAVREDNIAAWSSTGTYLENDSSSMIFGNLRAEHIAKAVSLTVTKTQYLKRILPVGVIVGSSIAALKKHFNVITGHDNGSHGDADSNCKLSSNIKMVGNEMDNGTDSESQRLDNSNYIQGEKNDSEKDSVMVGAVTAAVGASALLMQDSYMNEEETENITKSLNEKDYKDKEPDTFPVAIPETQNNLVSSIADKAMSVAGPVIPMNENGDVDQDRIVSMLANFGQNGGILRLVGKAALLWGGMRGAMSLTHKLISFLHLSERPLFQRLLGFGGMALLLWSPVYIPLLPTLVRGWATKNPSKSAELCCFVGLYVAVTVLIVLWGKRIRRYERPLKQYGLDFTLPMFKTYLMAYAGGALIVLSIQYVNTVIGCATVSFGTCIPLLSSTWLPEFGKILILVAQGTLSATGVVLVEELLFRSWLPAEISKEFGFHVGIIVAGFAFSVFQRSFSAIPGLWLLSMALAGAKERSQGSLSTPIGLRAGMMTTTFVLQKIGFLTFPSNVPLWFKVTDPIQPVTGVTGMAFSLLLAVYLYPRQPYDGIKAARKIRE